MEQVGEQRSIEYKSASVSSEGDPLNWILMTGVKLAQSLLNKNDSQSVSLSQASTSAKSGNKPTAPIASSPEAVVFKKGICQLAVTLEAQQKQSVWDRLLGLLNTASSVIGVKPIPKLYQTALTSVTSSLSQLEAQSAKTKLITILLRHAVQLQALFWCELGCRPDTPPGQVGVY